MGELGDTFDLDWASTRLDGVLDGTLRAPPTEPSESLSLPELNLGEVSVDADLVVQAELGRGGMGVVHLVHQTSLDRDVAVKRLHGGAGEGPGAIVLTRTILVSCS